MIRQFNGKPRSKIKPNNVSRKAQSQGATASSSKLSHHGLGPDKSAELTVEDISYQDTNYDADAESIRPYEYEEAGDESSPSSMKTSPASLRRIELDELWSNGLIESMSSLHCSPRRDNTSPSPEKRGQKRKSATSPELLQTASTGHATGLYFPRRALIRPKKPKKRHRSSDVKLPSLKRSMSNISQTEPMDTD